ncbi:hypothetical protein BWD162_013180 [Bartonella sp. WD16.2]|nr:hypothetical protein BWD162_013180 [Bartonella sp. WD16.2]
MVRLRLVTNVGNEAIVGKILMLIIFSKLQCVFKKPFRLLKWAYRVCSLKGSWIKGVNIKGAQKSKEQSEKT